MDNKSALAMHNQSVLAAIISWMFGILFLAIGLLNIFWGNDPGYGIAVSLLSLIYFPPVIHFLKNVVGLSIPFMVHVILGVLIMWTALGVAELFDKINLMLKDF